MEGSFNGVSNIKIMYAAKTWTWKRLRVKRWNWESAASHGKIVRDMEVKAMTLKDWAESRVGHLAGGFQRVIESVRHRDWDKHPTGNWNPAAHVRTMFPDAIAAFQKADVDLD